MTDAILMRLTDIGLSLPTILIAVVLVAVSEPSFGNVILVISLAAVAALCTPDSGETLAIKEQDFVALAVVAGRSSTWIISRHIFPNVVPTLLVICTLQVGYVILLEGSLSFLGVGVPPPNPAWGLMIADGRGAPGHGLVDHALPGPGHAPHRAGREPAGAHRPARSAGSQVTADLRRKYTDVSRISRSTGHLVIEAVRVLGIKDERAKDREHYCS